MSALNSVLPILALYGEDSVVLFDDPNAVEEGSSAICHECGEPLNEFGDCPNDCYRYDLAEDNELEFRDMEDIRGNDLGHYDDEKEDEGFTPSHHMEF